MNININNYKGNTGLITLFLYSSDDKLDQISPEFVIEYLTKIDNLDLKVAVDALNIKQVIKMTTDAQKIRGLQFAITKAAQKGQSNIVLEYTEIYAEAFANLEFEAISIYFIDLVEQKLLKYPTERLKYFETNDVLY